jgi:hypothetical protein
MQNQSIVQWLSLCVTEGCQRPVGQSDFELAVYLGFCIFNLGEVFNYYPTIQKLRSPGCTGDGQSVWTWVTWIMANGTLAMHLYVLNGYRPNDLVCLTLANLAMCCVCLRYIIQTQRRAGTLGWVPFRKPCVGYVLTVQLADELHHPLAHRADSAGQPINAMVTDAVRQYLAQPVGGMPSAVAHN